MNSLFNKSARTIVTREFDRTMRLSKLFGIALYIVIAASPRLLVAQATVGLQPFGTYTSGFDNISLSDLGVHINIPLFTHKARGANAGTTFSLHYDTLNLTSQGYGWQIIGSTVTGGSVVSFATDTNPCTNTLTSPGYYTDYVYGFADDSGYIHPFNGSARYYSNCYQSNGTPYPNTSLNEAAADGSGYLLQATGNPTGSAIVTDPHGTVYNSSSGLVTDSNGNVSTYFAIGEVGDTYGDFTYGTTLTDTSNVAVSISGGSATRSEAGVLTARSPTLIKYTDTTGTSQTITIAYEVSNVNCGAHCSAVPVALVSSVTYPDGSAYQFGYQTSSCDTSDSSGVLGSVELPTGASITYENTVTPDCSPGYGLGSLDTISSSNLVRTTSDGTTTYTRTVNASGIVYPSESTTVIKNPDNSTETVNFVYAQAGTTNPEYNNWYSEETAHTWVNSVGATLKSTMRCYNSTSGNCTTTAFNLPINQITTSTTFGGLPPSKTVQFINSSGQTTELDEYDYGATTPTRKTLTSYASLGNNIQDRPSSVTIENSSSLALSQTTYNYDEYSLASSSASGLAAVSGSRGNETSAISTVSSSATITTHTHYDEAGQVVCTVDASKASATSCGTSTTNYGYDSTDTYITSKTYPVVAAGTFSESYNWDSNTGLLVNSKDVNGTETAYTYNSMLRILGVCYPDGGYTLTGYPTTTSQTVGVLIAGASCTPGGASPTGTYATTTTQFDGYGRLIHTTDPAGFISDTTYNSRGLVASVSNPHGSGASDNGITTSYLYDAIGRETAQENQDGSFKFWCYNGSQDEATGQPNCSSNKSHLTTEAWVDYSDEVGNHSQQITDGLGRNVAVMEPNSSTNVPSLETDYTYDALSNLSNVSQWGGTYGSAGARVRTFLYDSLSRLTNACNPEALAHGLSCTASGPWSTTYSYISGTSVCAGATSAPCSKTDGRQITTTYAYDAWSRLTSKLYSDGTPSAFYLYDVNQYAGSYTTYPVGRLVEKWTSLSTTGTCPITATNIPQGVSCGSILYDPMGRVTGFGDGIDGTYGSSSTDAGSYVGSAMFSYNLAGNLKQRTTYQGYQSQADAENQLVVDFTYDVADRLNTVTLDPKSVGLNPALPSILFQGKNYSPVGLTGANFAINPTSSDPDIALTQTYDSRMRLTGASYETSSGAASGSGTTLYSFSIPGGATLGYATNGNVRGFTDSVNGTANVSYDSLNRMINGSVTAGTYEGLNVTWSYDNWGNRQGETFSGTPSFPLPTSTSAAYSTQNQITAGFSYDAAGNVTSDGNNLYAYDAEGRLCVTKNMYTNAYTSYVYDADGLRLAKASIAPASGTAFSSALCSPLTAGYTIDETYVYSPDGQQLQRFGGTYGFTWMNDNIYAGGTVLATLYGSQTYYGDQQYYEMADWVGTRRAQVTADGNAANLTLFTGLPFGNALNTVGPGPDTNLLHFGGKERDVETAYGTGTGNDFFEARSYNSTSGRFISPDPSQLYYADPTTPQSLNLYAYVNNNPLTFIDPTGLDLQLVCNPDHGTTTDDNTGTVIVTEILGGCQYVDDGNNSPQSLIGSLPAPPSIMLPTVKFQVRGNAPNNFVRMPLPANHLNCTTSTGVSFPAPPGFRVSNIAANGATNGLSGAGAAVGQGGYYDFQRFQVGSTTQFFSGYTPVANVAVGAYVQGTGAPQWMASAISNTYAFFKSSNGATAQQAQFRNLGFSLAAGKASYSCQPSIP